MTEQQLMNIESMIDDADPKQAAAIACAAICRIGELGREAGEEFKTLAESCANEADAPEFAEGAAWVTDTLLTACD